MLEIWFLFEKNKCFYRKIFCLERNFLYNSNYIYFLDCVLYGNYVVMIQDSWSKFLFQIGANSVQPDSSFTKITLSAWFIFIENLLLFYTWK